MKKTSAKTILKRSASLILCVITLLLCACADSDTPDTSDIASGGVSDVINETQGAISEDTELQTQSGTSDTETVYEDTQTESATETDGITSAPATQPPVTQVPETQAPETQAPETQAPETQAPETQAPETQPPAPTVKTDTPTILGTYSQAADRIIIYGETEPDAKITYKCEGGITYTDSARGKYFYVEVNGAGKKNVTLYATADGKKASNSVSFDVSFENIAATSVFGGRNSRLYLRGTHETLFGSSYASNSTLESVRKLIDARLKTIQSLTGKDTKLIYILAPNPVNVYYDEMYPYLETDTRAPTASMQFASYMNGAGKHDDIIVPELIDVFELHKDEPIYFRTDTHWSELGAYYAYVEMMKYIRKDFPNATSHPLSDFNVIDTDCSAGDLSGMLKAGGMRECTPMLHAKFEQTGQFYNAKRDAGDIVCNIPVGTYPKISTVDDPSLPTGYLIGDSYGAFFLPFAGMGFRTLTVNDAILWDYSISAEKLKAEKPDYIIFVYTDRNIPNNLLQLVPGI